MVIQQFPESPHLVYPLSCILRFLTSHLQSYLQLLCDRINLLRKQQYESGAYAESNAADPGTPETLPHHRPDPFLKKYRQKS